MLRESHAMVGTDAPAQEISKRGAAGSKTRARAVLDRPPALQGWRTTDEEEIELRRWRGRTEIGAIEPLEPGQPVSARSACTREPAAPTRSRSAASSTARTPAAASTIASTGSAPASTSRACSRLFGAARTAFRPTAKWSKPARRDLSRPSRRRAARALSGRPGSAASCGRARMAGSVPRSRRNAESRRRPRSPTADGLAGRACACAPPHCACRAHFGPWLERQQRQRRSRDEARAAFLPRSSAARASFDLVQLPLLPYQREGMLHLAFGERALLADEMGLGKTVQAIAACELLARRKGIATRAGRLPGLAQGGVGGADRPLHRASGTVRVRPARSSASPPIASRPSSPSSTTSRCWPTPTTSTRVLAPDIVILDEAQRIKNWQTKTARRVKSLQLALRLRADRHADREPHRRALFDRPVPRPGAVRTAVPLQPRVLLSSTSAAGRSTTRTSPSCAAAWRR